MKKLLQALSYAAECHADQRRKDSRKTPYINHPIGVARILADHGVEDEDVLCAAVLHDVIEDTDGTYEEISQLFGKRVAGIVAEVTDDRTLTKEERKRRQVETVAKKSPSAKLVKLADKMYNVLDIPPEWSKERRDEYVNWAREVVGQIHGVNERLEKTVHSVFEKDH